jgi:hypothetical protein
LAASGERKSRSAAVIMVKVSTFVIAIPGNGLLTLVDDREATNLRNVPGGNLVMPTDFVLNERIGNGARLPIAHTPSFFRISFNALSGSRASASITFSSSTISAMGR